MLFTLVCFVLGFTLGGFAQRLDGTLGGTLLDPSGAVVTGATVTVTNEQTGVSQSTRTTSSGTYVFPNLLVGVYTVVVDAKGFQKTSIKNIHVLPSQINTADVKLTVGGEGTTVEVAAGSELLQTTTSQISNDFGARSVAELPNPAANGSPLNLAILAPGTTTQGAGVLGEGGSIGGARPRLNSFNIDGVDDNRIDVTGHTSEVIQDAVADFNLVTNQFSAELGHSAGGQFNIVTKSGTNTWHGSAWEYNNNRDFNAMDNLEKASDLTAPRRIDYNRAGGTIGGPLIKNKLFIFGAYQQIWQGLATSSVLQTAPTAAGLAQLKALAPNSAITDLLSEFPVAPAADAASAPVTVNGVTSQIEMGNIQPSAPNFLNQRDFNINADLNVAKHQLRGRVLYDRQRQPNVNPVTPISKFTGDIAADSRKIIFTDAWAISDHVVNDFRASYSRFVQAYTVPAQFANFPNVEVDDLSLNVGPEGNSPQSYVQNNYQILNNITYVHGRHTFKFGPEWRHWIAPSNFLPRSRGEWDYANINEFINDLVPTGSNGALRGAGSGAFAGNQNAIYWFVQDDWKVTPNLTLNLGLRYEWMGNPRDASLQNLNAISTLPGVFEFRTPKSDRNNYAPRFGFAWDPGGAGKWAIRGGFGLSYDITAQNFTLLQLPPQLQTEQNPDITCSGAAGTPPSWCPSYLANQGGRGFLGGGGLAQVNVPPVTQADARANTGSIIVDTVQPKVMTWTLGVQRELTSNDSLEVRYLGTRAVHLPVQARLNTRSAFSAGLQELPTYFSLSAIPATITGGPRLSDFVNYDPLIYSAEGFQGLVTAFPAIGGSTYHGGSVDYNHRTSHGLLVRANYTFAHNIDDSTNELFSSLVNPRRPQDWQHMGLDRGRSTLDIRHKLALSWIYDLPTWKGQSGFAKTILSGWQWNGTYIAQSGQPISILSGTDSNGNADSAGDRAIINPNGSGNTGTGVDLVCVGAGGATSTATVSAGCAGGSANVAGYVAANPGAHYVQARLGARSNVGRNTFQSPGINIWNMGMFKSTKIGERFTIAFRADALNVFNHRNFTLAQPSVFQNGGGTVNNALSSSYANVTAADFLNEKQFSGGSRTMQLGLRLSF